MNLLHIFGCVASTEHTVMINQRVSFPDIPFTHGLLWYLNYFVMKVKEIQEFGGKKYNSPFSFYKLLLIVVSYK